MARTNITEGNGRGKAGGVVTVPWGTGMAAGTGYDYLARESKGVSPAENEKEMKFADSEGLELVDVSVLRVENVDELQDYLRIEAGVSGAFKLFSASASSDFVNNVRMNAYSIYFLIKAVAICNIQRLTSQMVLHEADAKLREQDFREKYGDHFVSARKKGSAFFALLEMKTTSQETRQAVVSELEMGFGGGKAGPNLIKANFSNSVMKAARHEGVSLSMRVIAQGIGGDFLKLTQDRFKAVEPQKTDED